MRLTKDSFFRLAHISDLHFSRITWNPCQFFSKRWLGNFNLLFMRRHVFDADSLTSLLPIFHERSVRAVLITGDLSSTSHREEFRLAQQFVTSLQKEKFKVFTLPGNHDQYTKSAWKQQLFYQFFNESYGTSAGPLSSLSLKRDGIAAADLGSGWWLVALDTALATPLLSSNGYFSAALEQKLEIVLKEIPVDDNVILINHFPVFSSESQRKSLIRKEALRKLLESFPNVKLYLHGHTHRHCIADLRSSHLPIFMDSGSTSRKKEGTWNLIEIGAEECRVEVFQNTCRDARHCWEPVRTSQFTW